MSEKRKVARSSRTGRFVSKEYAREHPDTTQIETITYPEVVVENESENEVEGML